MTSRPSSLRTMDQTDARRTLFVYWIGGLSFAFGLLVMFLMQRLGLPLYLVITITGSFSALVVLALAWHGRTMTSLPFYFAGRSLNSAQVGLSGTSDWLTGGVLLLLVNVSLVTKITLVPALVLGMILQAALFAGPFQRSGTATLPGFLTWRTSSKTVGFLALISVVACLALFSLAEFQILKLVASNMFSSSSKELLVALVVLAVLPSLIGGWTSLLWVNGILTIWVLMSMLITASALAFIPDFLARVLLLDPNLAAIAPLPTISDGAFGFFEALSGEPYSAFLALIVVAFGFSSIPHSFSRLALNTNSVSATEAVGWSALFVFLLLSAIPLSIALVASTPSSEALSDLLKQHSVLYSMPHFAVLFAAFNVVAVTLMALATTIVRLLRRSRSLDPSEQSMSAVRLLVIVFASALVFVPPELVPPTGALIFLGLSIIAGSLFFPLLFSVWIRRQPAWCISLAILAGTSITGAGLAGYLPLPAFKAAGAGMMGCLFFLLLGLFWTWVSELWSRRAKKLVVA